MTLTPSDDRLRHIVWYSQADTISGLLGMFPELAIEDTVYGSFGKTGGALCTGGSVGAVVGGCVALTMRPSSGSRKH